VVWSWVQRTSNASRLVLDFNTGTFLKHFKLAGRRKAATNRTQLGTLASSGRMHLHVHKYLLLLYTVYSVCSQHLLRVILGYYVRPSDWSIDETL
jgi:hypothetical protein